MTFEQLGLNAPILNALREMGYHVAEPGGAFYLFPRSLEPDDVAFCKKATELDLFLVPGTAFGCPGHFRLAFCVEDEVIARSAEGFKRARG